MTTWFTADLHVGHGNVINYCDRPFRDGGGNPDVPMQTEILVRNWNSLVQPGDVVYVIGDAVMGNREKNLRHFGRLNGEKILIPGNHDYCWHGLWANKPEKRARWEAAYAEFFTVLHDPQTLVIGDTEFRLNHFPYEGDSEEEDRYPQHRPVDDGMPLLHGHIHDMWQTKRSPAGTLMLNVGVDVHGFFPISEDQVLALAKAAG